MSNLSDVTQNILDVMWFDQFETALDKRSLAADIIRVVADQVASPPQGDGLHDCCARIVEQVRADLLAIAAELEGQ
jgi:hypothetical protein